MSHPYLTRHVLSDHQRRERAKQEAADFCIIGIVALIIFCALLGVILGAAGV